jgi:hypothetical protein
MRASVRDLKNDVADTKQKATFLAELTELHKTIDANKIKQPLSETVIELRTKERY